VQQPETHRISGVRTSAHQQRDKEYEDPHALTYQRKGTVPIHISMMVSDSAAVHPILPINYHGSSVATHSPRPATQSAICRSDVPLWMAGSSPAMTEGV
jgi:hypothetical protein